MANGPFYEPGRYWGRVTRQKLGKTRNGNPQLVLTFLVVGKVNPAEPDGDLLGVPEQYERSLYRVITDNTLDYVIQDLDTLGFVGDSYSQFDEEDLNCCSLFDKEYAFYCSHKPREVKDEATGTYVPTGELREEWSLARETTGVNVEPLDKKEARQLDAMFGKALKQLGGKKPTAEKPPPQESAPRVHRDPAEAPPDDEIPF